MHRIKQTLIILIVFFFLSSLTKTIVEYRKNLTFYSAYEEEYNKEKKTNEELKTQLAKQQDSYEFEKLVRNKLNVHKPNEYIVIIPEPSPTVLQPTPTSIPNHIQWWQVFTEGENG